MNLHKKVLKIYPELSDYDFYADANSENPSILFRNDGQGDYIAVWKHPTLPKPTPDELKAVRPAALETE